MKTLELKDLPSLVRNPFSMFIISGYVLDGEVYIPNGLHVLIRTSIQGIRFPTPKKRTFPSQEIEKERLADSEISEKNMEHFSFLFSGSLAFLIHPPYGHTHPYPSRYIGNSRYSTHGLSTVLM